MIQRLKFAFFILLAGGAAWFAPAAKADVWNKETVLTFSGPVEIPGQVLPAGTYVFKLADSQSNRDIVQVFSEDQKHLLATIMAIPDYRNEPADKTIVTFKERQSGSPEALRSWFYPGDIGSVSADHVLVISGRQTAVLNIGGNKIGPEAVEQVVLGFAGVQEAGAFGVKNEFGIDEVWTAIVASPGFDEAGLHRHCQSRLAPEFVPRRFLPVSALPRNANGKLDRRRLSELAGPVDGRS